LDELDDYEAELELRLKKEYSAVYALFRFCVLTQDATYLCNKLDLQYVPQPSYPFFHVKMEDVWVWDKNRPRRMIPRVEVYTSADVTVEELKGEGDEPELTADELAKRLSDRLHEDVDREQQRPSCRRQHADRLRPVRGRRPLAAVPRRDRSRSHGRRACGDAPRVRRARDARRDRPLLVCAAARPRVRGVRRTVGRRRAARARPRRLDGSADQVRRPARGRPRPNRERGRRARTARYALRRRRLRNLDELRRRLGGGGVRRRRARTGRRDLDGRAVRTRCTAAEGPVRRAAARDL